MNRFHRTNFVAALSATLLLAPLSSSVRAQHYDSLGGLLLSAPTLRMKDLTSDWRRVMIRQENAAAAAPAKPENPLAALFGLAVMGENSGKNDTSEAAAMMALFGGEETAYYTRGETLTVGGVLLLVLYQQDRKPVSFADLAVESARNGGKEPDFAKLMADSQLTQETPLMLTLVRLDRITALQEIRPVELEREIAEGQKQNAVLEIMQKEKSRPAGSTVEAEPVTDTAAENTTPMTDSAPTDEAARALTQRIYALLASDTQLGNALTKLAVSATGNSVVLNGHVANARMQNRAANLARPIAKQAGMSLVNQIEVRP